MWYSWCWEFSILGTSFSISKIFDSASVMKAWVFSYRLAAVAIFPLTGSNCSKAFICLHNVTGNLFPICKSKKDGSLSKGLPIRKAWNETWPFSINWVPCCWIIVKGDFHISLFIHHWCITFHLRCLQVLIISNCSHWWQNIFILGNTYLLNMDALAFLLMVVMHLHFSLTCHQHKDKDHDHRGNCILFWKQCKPFQLICHTLFDTCAQVAFILSLPSRLLWIFGFSTLQSSVWIVISFVDVTYLPSPDGLRLIWKVSIVLFDSWSRNDVASSSLDNYSSVSLFVVFACLSFSSCYSFCLHFQFILFFHIFTQPTFSCG